MTRIAALAVLVTCTMAHAGPGMIEYGAGQPARALEAVRPVGCEVRVDVRGAVATVELREQLANGGSLPLAVRAAIALPAGAVMIGAAITVDRAMVPAVAVPAQFSSTMVAGSVLGADPLVVRASADGPYAVIQPIEPGHEVTLITRYAVIGAIARGAIQLALPAHDVGPACRGTVHVTPGPGARLAAIRIAGAAGDRFTLGAKPVAIDIALDFAAATPVVWTQTERLDAEWSATLVTAIAPPARARGGASHAVFVIDTSRSMDLVGRPRLVQVMRAIAAALPTTTELEVIVYDRAAARVLGQFGPNTPATLDALEAGIRRPVAGNGSDLAAALAVAHTALAGLRGSSLVIPITDGMLGEPDGAALTAALDSTAIAVDVHAIVVDPARTRSPGAGAMRALINRYGGTLVELDTDELDRTIATIGDDWLRPAALELALGPGAIDDRGVPPGGSAAEGRRGVIDLPSELPAGRGVTRFAVRRDVAALSLTGHGDAAFRVAAREAPAAPIAPLALAGATFELFAGPDNPSADARGHAQLTLDRARAAHPAVDDVHALAALATAGKVAASRRQMIAGGGPYERTILLADLPLPAALAATPSSPAPSAIDRLTLERLFRDQLQPRAYVCYQRALGSSPHLAGTASFELQLGRGEVSHVAVTGVVDPAFEACLLDAGYALQPPLPDFTVNADDQTVARYPLSFTVRDQHPVILPGDADSTSPLDIDAIQGGVPARRRPIHVDAATPLGGLPHR